jgi:hypothetical protein
VQGQGQGEPRDKKNQNGNANRGEGRGTNRDLGTKNFGASRGAWWGRAGAGGRRVGVRCVGGASGAAARLLLLRPPGPGPALAWCVLRGGGQCDAARGPWPVALLAHVWRMGGTTPTPSPVPPGPPTPTA